MFEEQCPSSFTIDMQQYDQPPQKTKRFASLNEKQLDELLDGAHSKSTKYSTNHAISVYKDWAFHKGFEREIHELSIDELDENLKMFYAEVRSKNGDDYSKNTLLGLRSGIERYLNGPPHNKGIQISANPLFKKSNMMLNAKLKSLKQQGKLNVQHKPAIEVLDLRKLKTSPAISPSNPLALLMNVWFHITLYWCRRGREGQRNLKKSSFRFNKDENGRAFATMTHDEASKNHPGGFDDVESYEKYARMYQTDDPNDGYDALRLYLAKLNPKCDAFFQFPKRNWLGPSDEVWYENRCLGVNKLGNMMKELSLSAQLSKIYTNHSVRATAITLWSDAGLSNRHIMTISGHRNEQSLQSYNSRPSSKQLQKCSDVISKALGSMTENPQILLQPSENINQDVHQIQCTATHSNASVRQNFASMFSGCSIGTVNVSFNKHDNDQQIELF